MPQRQQMEQRRAEHGYNCTYRRSQMAVECCVYEELEDNEIKIWKCDKEGDLTHSSSQWRYLAWMRPKIRKGRLIFNIIAGEETLSKRIYGVYHGRLIEMLLTYFDVDIDKLYATVLPTSGDIVE